MPETIPSKATPTPTKRRSVLGDLGIKPGGAPPARSAARPSSTPATAKPAPSRATSLNRQSTPSPTRSSNGPVPSRAASLNRKTSTATTTTTTRARKSSTATPRPISVHGTLSSSSSPGTPTTPTTPSRRPVSMHHQTTPAPRPSATPMSRRASMNPTPSSRSGTSTPRLTSPVETELKALQEQIAQKDALMEEQQQKIQTLQQQLETQKETDQDTLQKANGRIDALQKQVDQVQLQKDNFEKEKLELKAQLEQAGKDTIEEQAKQAQAQVEALLAEHQQETEKLVSKYDQQLNDLKMSMEVTEQESKSSMEAIQQEYATLKQDYATLQHQHTTLTEQHQVTETERDTFSQKAIDMEATLASSKEANHVRDLEQQLAAARQATDALERRFRDEMQQTQNDHDDTAQTWLTTHQRTQTELDRLQQVIAESEHRHALALQEAHDQLDAHQQEADDRLVQLNDDRDAQSQHIDTLESQIEDLQTRLEEATLRLENHAAAMKPSLSNHQESGSVNHDACQQKYTQLEQQLADCKRQLEEGSTTSHESCHQKHTELEQQLADSKRQLEEQQQKNDATLHVSCQQKHAELEQQLQAAVAEHKQYLEDQQLSKNNAQQQQDALDQHEEKSKAKLIDVAQQHKKEVQLLHDQYQQLVDLKDQELEAYAYRVKALNLARQKDLDSCRSESADRMHQLEQQIEGYEATIYGNNEKIMELQTQLAALEQQAKQDQHAIQILTRERGSLRDENDQLIRLVNQLQGELHR